MKTLALSMILKNEAENIGRFLEKYKHHFDKIVIVDTGSTDDTVDICKKHGATLHEVGDRFLIKPKKTEIKQMQELYSEVPDDVRIFDFSAARNYAFSLIDTDYAVWLDADDEVDLGPIPYKEVIQAVDPQYDGFYWGYNYAQNSIGESIALHWRERLIRMNPRQVLWKGLVHETMIPIKQGYMATWADDKSITVHHHKNLDEHEQSFSRNHTTLIYEYVRDGDKTDPRTLQYLGTSHIHLKDWRKAIFFLTKHIERTGWPEDAYRSWRHLSECYRQLDYFDRVVFCEQQALNIKTDWPDAWYGMAEAYLRLKDFDKALDYIEIGLKRESPDTLSVVDPTLYTYKPVAMAMMSYFGKLDIPRAWKAAEKLMQLAPKYELTQKYYPIIRDAYFEGEYIKRIIWQCEYLKRVAPDKIEDLIRSIPNSLQFDDRISEIKMRYRKPRVHADNEVVFLCGGVEKWSPLNVSKGIGGSEEAVIYLSKALENLGYKVTVYNTCADDAGEYDGVTYLPSSDFNPNDQFATIVAWRMPAFFKQNNINAKRKLVDLHDAPVGHQDIPKDIVDSVDKFMFKSKFQRDVAKHIPDSKCMIVPNGIVSGQFTLWPNRNPKRVIYASSYDRGLPELLYIWKRVKKEVPDAELHVYYGWNTYDTFFKGDPERMKWKWQMIREMADLGVVEHGRVSHEELAEAFKQSGIWAYPTHFPEISCITAMKAQAAGCTPITSGYAALQETVPGEKDVTEDGQTPITDNPKKLEAFADRLIKSLKKPEGQKARQDRAMATVARFDWGTVAKGWAEAIG